MGVRYNNVVIPQGSHWNKTPAKGIHWPESEGCTGTVVDGLCNSARPAHLTTGTGTRDGSVEGSYGRIILFVGLHVGH